MSTFTHQLEHTPPARPAGNGSNSNSQVLGMDVRNLATGLGWLSIGLGIAELFAPRAVAQIAGTRNHRSLIRGYGLREIASDIGILEQPQQPGAVWSRVVGDALDLAALGVALASPKNDRTKTLGAIAAVAGVTALDILCAQHLSQLEATGEGTERGKTSVSATVVVGASPQECYRFWRSLDNAPRFMSMIQNVEVRGERTSHWFASLDGKKTVEWDAEITEDQPDRSLAWRSLPGSDFYHSGSVQFEQAAGGRGTLVQASFNYSNPLSAAALLGKLVGKDPEQVLYKDLRRFKQLVETGEIITTDGQSAGRTDGATWLDSIAR